MGAMTISALGFAPMRRVLDGYDLAFARQQRRLRRGWQCIAHQLRCNETDLRIAMGDLPPPETAPSPTQCATLSLRKTIALAIGEGATSARAVAAATGLDRETVVHEAIRRMRRSGLLAPGGHQNGGPLTLTATGEQLLALAIEAREAADA